MTKRFRFIELDTLLKTLICLFIATSVCSCVTPWKTNYLQKRPGVNTYTEMDSVELFAEYRLQPSDQLSIILSSTNKEAVTPYTNGVNMAQFGMMPNFASDLYTYTIYGDSCIDFPHLGSIKVVGLTTRETQDLLKEKLSSSIPDVEVTVKLVGSYFAIIGHSNGIFPISEKRMNIFQALSVAGDLPNLASRKHIRILRRINGKTTVREFDVRSKDIINSEFYYIQPNDIIYVPSFSGQFFAVSSFTEVLSAITSTLSFGFLLYTYSTKGF